MEISFDDAVDICARFGEFYESLDDVFNHIYDEETLPMPKTIILKAMIVAFIQAPDENYRNAIVTASTVLANFQPNIGGKPLSNGLQINKAMDILEGRDWKELSREEGNKFLSTLHEKGSTSDSDIAKFEKFSRIGYEERQTLLDNFVKLGNQHPISSLKSSASKSDLSQMTRAPNEKTTAQASKQDTDKREMRDANTQPKPTESNDEKVPLWNYIYIGIMLVFVILAIFRG